MINEIDSDLYISVVTKLLRHFVHGKREKNQSTKNCELCSEILDCKNDENTSDSLSQLNSTIKIKQELLRHLLLTHRWKDASEVLSSLFMESGQNAPPICQLVRVGLELKSQLGWSKDLDSFIESAIATSPNDSLTIEIDRFLHEVSSKFEHGIVVGINQSSSTGLEEFASRLRDARRYSTSKRFKNIEIARTTHIDKFYAGAISYIQAILSNAELNKLQKDDVKKEEMDKLIEDIHFKLIKLHDDIKTHVQTADNYFHEALKLCPVGPWDSFVQMHVDLLRRFDNFFPDYKQTIRIILESFSQSNPRNKNAWKMLAEFYVSLRLDAEEDVNDDEDLGDVGVGVLEKICEIDCFDETCLLLVRSGLSSKPNISYLFKMLDGFQWKDSFEVWILLCKDLIKILTAENQEERCLIEQEWAIRYSWWPKFHFQVTRMDDNRVLFLKATVAGLLLGKKDKFFKEIWKKRNSCSSQEVQHLLIISHNLNNIIDVVPQVIDLSDDVDDNSDDDIVVTTRSIDAFLL